MIKQKAKRETSYHYICITYMIFITLSHEKLYQTNDP